MRVARIPMLWVALVCLALPTLRADEEAAPGRWIPLFNGKDLTGWTPKIAGHALGENVGETFRVEDGLLKVAYDRYERFDGRFGHLFHDGVHANYRLRVEYRFVGDLVPGAPGWALRNSGIMIHGQSPDSMTRDQRFPVSVEVQLLGGTGRGERPTANLCTPGTHVVMDGSLVTRHCTSSRARTIHGDEWVTVIVEVRGDAVRHLVDGEVVLAYTGTQLDPQDADAQRLVAAGQPLALQRGTISLQSEGHAIHFRRIDLMELPAAEKPAAEAGWTDLLEGNDLSRHWETRGNWTIDAEGVVRLVPRPGERGWSRFDAYLWSKERYRDFEIEFAYRVEPRSNSGFYLHVGDRSDPVRQGLEVQIFDSHGKDPARRLTDHDAGGIIPGVPPERNAARPPGAWNDVRVSCRGRRLTVTLNGEVVNRVSLDEARWKGRPAEGYIGFQDHALPLALKGIRIRR